MSITLKRKKRKSTNGHKVQTKRWGSTKWNNMLAIALKNNTLASLTTTFIANTLIALCQTATNKKEKKTYIIWSNWTQSMGMSVQYKLVQLTGAHEAVNYTTSWKQCSISPTVSNKILNTDLNSLFRSRVQTMILVLSPIISQQRR